jgi:hypothetical protein
MYILWESVLKGLVWFRDNNEMKKARMVNAINIIDCRTMKRNFETVSFKEVKV